MKKILLLSTCSLFLITACGGGGGGGTTAPTPTPTPTPPASGWQQGVFANSADFKDQCAVVRTQPDINGDAYPDQQGTDLDEKFWLRSWTHETYLWYDEVDDRDPGPFTSPQSYFDVLVTNETTPSGARKDNFHFLQPTDEYEQFSQAGVQTGYGIDWTFIQSAPPRDIRVISVDPNSSADQEGVQRGDRLISIGGVDAINGNEVNFLNDNIFPSTVGTSVEFTFEKTDGTEATYTLVTGNYEKSFVNNVNVFETSEGSVGYVRFDGFQRTGQGPLIDAFQRFVDENVTELILDIRYNGGGLVAMSSQLAYMIAGPVQTDGRTYDIIRVNDKSGNVNPVTGETIRPTPFYPNEIDWEEGVFTNTVLPSLSLSTVYVITTEDTCSASESLINGLRGIDIEVVQIGNQTCGKPYGFYPTDNCGTTYFTIQLQATNEKGFGEYAEGFKPRLTPQFQDELPGCTASDDFSSPLGVETESMLATALERLETGSCPAPSNADVSKSTSLAEAFINAEQASELSVFEPRYRSVLLENKIYVPLKSETEE